MNISARQAVVPAHLHLANRGAGLFTDQQIFQNVYYRLKPLIPRRLQLYLRRQIAQRKRIRYTNEWPILSRARNVPVAWSGWAEQKQFAFVLIHDVETAAGQDKTRHLMDMEIKRGFRSCYNFVPERYPVSEELRTTLLQNGFEIGVHGLTHDGKLFRSERIFIERAVKINRYLSEWKAHGFCSPSSHHRLEWNHLLNIEYDSSTFDTDPFEVQPDGLETIFPIWIPSNVPAALQIARRKQALAEVRDPDGYVELPYTLPQDFYLFILLKEPTIDIWKQKLDWIAKNGGLALLITHPDYMNFDGIPKYEEYPVSQYFEFLDYAKKNYGDVYWHTLPKHVADYWRTWATSSSYS
ncbi:MAG: hypothetical protein AAF702_13560 [Chloroflexota bacterium]